MSRETRTFQDKHSIKQVMSMELVLKAIPKKQYIERRKKELQSQQQEKNNLVVIKISNK